MAITEKFTTIEKKRAKAVLGVRGRIKDCAARTGIHRTTVSRIKKTGEGEEGYIAKIREYLNQVA